MKAEELKIEIKKILGEQVSFNREFDFFAENIKNNETLFEWCSLIREKKVKPISNSVLGNQIVFLKRIGGSTRCIIIKIINGEVKEVHLADHDYYNKKMKELGLKKSSRTY